MPVSLVRLPPLMSAFARAMKSAVDSHAGLGFSMSIFIRRSPYMLSPKSSHTLFATQIAALVEFVLTRNSISSDELLRMKHATDEALARLEKTLHETQQRIEESAALLERSYSLLLERSYSLCLHTDTEGMWDS